MEPATSVVRLGLHMCNSYYREEALASSLGQFEKLKKSTTSQTIGSDKSDLLHSQYLLMNKWLKGRSVKLVL